VEGLRAWIMPTNGSHTPTTTAKTIQGGKNKTRRNKTHRRK